MVFWGRVLVVLGMVLESGGPGDVLKIVKNC